jgi:RNA binding exosome subunit
VKRPFIALHARTICHSTENLEKVKLAFSDVLGESPLEITKTEGHHGNTITIIESVLDSPVAIGLVFSRLSDGDLERLRDSAESRIDGSCNLFMRLDKQAAFAGNLVISASEDAISLRLRVSAFPKKPEVAVKVFKDYVDSEIARKRSAAGPQ